MGTRVSLSCLGVTYPSKLTLMSTHIDFCLYHIHVATNVYISLLYVYMSNRLSL